MPQKAQCSHAKLKKHGTTGRLGVTSMDSILSSFMITVTDGPKPMCGRDRTDDKSDLSILSAPFAEKAVLNGDVKIENIDKLVIQVVMKDGVKAQAFYCNRIWSAPRTVLSLSVRPLALEDVSLLLAVAEL